MSDQTRIKIMYVGKELDDYILIGSMCGIRTETSGIPTPERFESVDIEDGLKSMQADYQEQVDAIPDLRQACTYPCETQLEMINFLIGLKAVNVAYTPSNLMIEFLRYFKGSVNPAVVREFIDELVDTGLERLNQTK